MKIEVPFGKSVLRVVVEVGVTSRFGEHPLHWNLGDQYKLAHEIARMISLSYSLAADGSIIRYGNHKIGRIRACRVILQNRQLPYDLVRCKEFVEVAFADYGKGSEIVLLEAGR